MRSISRITIAIFFVSLAGSSARAAEEISFSKQVWPIFRQHCWSCHSGDKAEGALRFDVEEHFRRGGESGPAFVAGKPDDSGLIEQVSGKKPAMPPKGPPIGDAKVAILRDWIAAGAKIDSMPMDQPSTAAIPATYDYAPAITSVSIHPDGRRAACACRSEVSIVSLADDAAPQRLATDCDLLSHVEYSPDGKLLAAVGGTPAQFGEVRFFDAETGAVVASRRLTSDTLFRGNFSPDGKAIAVGGADGLAYIVPVDGSAEIRKFDLHSDWVVDVAWTPDGTKLVTAGRDKTTKIASVETRELLRTVDTSLERTNAVVADDALAVSAGLTRSVTGFQLSIALQNVELSGGGNGARPVSRREQYVKAYEALPGEVLDMALSGDRKVLAVAGRAPVVSIFTLADQKRTAQVTKIAGPVYSVALNQDGTLLAVGGRSGKLDLYQLPAGTLVKSIAPVPVKGLLAEAAASAK